MELYIGELKSNIHTQRGQIEFLKKFGNEILGQQPNGEWICDFDTPSAIEKIEEVIKIYENVIEDYEKRR